MAQEDKIHYAFSAGEVSEFYAQRSDLNKFDIGLGLCRNFFVDPRGGISSRQGSQLVGGFKGALRQGRLFRFRGTEQDFLLVFGHNYMRVIQNGGYALEGDLNVTINDVSGDAIVTAAGHGFAEEDWVYVNSMTNAEFMEGRLFRVSNVTTNTFELNEPGYDMVTGADLSGVATGTISRVYTLATPFVSGQLHTLSFEQSLNQVRISSLEYPRYRLNFISATNWNLVEISSGTALPPPENVTLDASSTGDAGIAFVVTAITANGGESVGSEYVLIQDSVNYSVTQGSMRITWDPVPRAVRYHVYRSLIIPGTAEVTKGEAVGYIGTAYGAQFTDNNITPDFTKTPPVHVDPFATGEIENIEITDGGSGYEKSDTISVSGGGTGFDGYPIVSDDGVIVGVSIVNGGSGYSSPATVTVTTGTGVDAAFDVSIGPDSGVNPKLFKTFQERGLYFGTENEPNTVWASRPRAFNNYDRSTQPTAADPYEFTIDSIAVKPIKHAIALRSGLLIFNSDGVTQLKAETGKVVTGANAVAEPQVYASVSDTTPIAYNLDVIFSTANSEKVYAMLYTEYTESFKLEDLSILSSHLIGLGKEISRFVPTSLPANIIYMPRSDGRELTLTYLREQEVFAWAQHETQGYIRDCEVVEEYGVSVKYQLVKRYLKGKWRQFIERVPARQDDLAENYWGVDCGLNYPLTEGTVDIAGEAITEGETSVINAGGNFFTNQHVGDIIYYAGGKFEITARVSPAKVEGTWLRLPSNVLPQNNTMIPTPVDAGQWCIATPTTVVGGLWHLEGEAVSVCADGDAYLNMVVENGQVVLPVAATKIFVGLQYVCDFQSLPVNSSQMVSSGKMAKIYSMFPRLYASRGMSFGTSFDKLQELPDRSEEAWGAVTALRTDLSQLLLEDSYELDKRICGRQVYPLPATVLGYTVELDVGDTG
jgi:hypothetical protein